MATPSIWTRTIARERFRNASMRRPPFDKVLAQHCTKIVTARKHRELIVQLELKVEGTCPITHEKSVLRVIDELLSNSIEHGFYNRQIGHALVHVISRKTVGVKVSVIDDGWGFPSGPIIAGNGFHLLREMGDLRLEVPAGGCGAKTTITVVIPLQRCGLCGRCHAAASPGPTKASR